MTTAVHLKLVPDSLQKTALEDTMKACNLAADWLSERGFSNGIFSQFSLQTRYYRDVRTMFGIGAQAACLICAKVADAYKLDRNVQRKFRPFGSIAFDIRNLKIHIEKRIVSIWTTTGRAKIPFLMGEFQANIIARGLIKQCDLVRRRDGKIFLSVIVVLPDEMELKVSDVLGVDLGIANIAADSDGNVYSGKD